MADMNIAGHKMNKWVVYGGAGVLGLGAILYFKNRSGSGSSSSTTSTQTGTDPVTGLPYSMDSQVDPATGMTYLSEAQQYGSVSAAEAGMSAGYGGVSGGGYGSSGYGYGTPTYTTSDTSSTPNVYATNAEWAQAAEAGLTALGYSSTDVAAALGRYLGNLSETADQATIVQAAVAEYGPPPVGSYQILQQSSSPGPTSTGSVAVPNVVGQKAGDAHNALVSAGLVPTADPAEKAYYIVTSTSPAAGTEVAPGTRVTIVAPGGSSGGSANGLITVPDLAGQSAGNAHNALTSLGLVPVAPPSQKANMKVWYTNPRAGSMVSKGTHVTIDTQGYV